MSDLHLATLKRRWAASGAVADLQELEHASRRAGVVCPEAAAFRLRAMLRMVHLIADYHRHKNKEVSPERTLLAIALIRLGIKTRRPPKGKPSGPHSDV